MARRKRRSTSTRRRARRRTTHHRRNPRRRVHHRRAPVRHRRRRVTHRRRNPIRRRRNPVTHHRRRRRRRNPVRGRRIRPTLYRSRKGTYAPHRSKTFRKRRSIIRRNPRGKFSLKRAFDTKSIVAGLQEAAFLTAGIAATGFLKTAVVSKLTSKLGVGAGPWVDKAVTIATAALGSELLRAFGVKEQYARLIFVGGCFAVVRDLVKEYAPGTVSSYISGFITIPRNRLPARRGMAGFLNTSSRIAQPMSLADVGSMPIGMF